MTSSNFRAASTARTRPHKSGAAPIPLVFPFILWNRALAALSCAFCRPHLPKVLCGTAAASFFNILKYECKSSFRHSPVPFLSTVFPHWGAEPRKCRNRDSTSATPEATLPETKPECFAHKSVSPVNSHTSNIVTLLCCFHTWAALAHHVFAMMTGL